MTGRPAEQTSHSHRDSCPALKGEKRHRHPWEPNGREERGADPTPGTQTAGNLQWDDESPEHVSLKTSGALLHKFLQSTEFNT